MFRLRRVALALLVLVLPASRSEAQSCTSLTPIGPGDNQAFDLVAMPDGRFVLVGYAHNGVNEDIAIARYNPDGTLDVSFDTDGIATLAIGGASNERARGAAVQADGKLVVVGFSDNGGTDDFVILRYNLDGSLDTSFDTDGIVVTPIGASTDRAFAVEIQGDGKIVVGGYALLAGDDMVVARYNTNGSLDTTFDFDGIATTDVGSVDRLLDLLIQPDGKIVIAGRSNFAGDAAFSLVRYNTNGSLDATFDGDGIVTTQISAGLDRAEGLAIQPDGKLVAGGIAFNGTNNDFAVVRYNPNGSLDTSFDTDGIVTTPIGPGDDEGDALVIQPDGKILLAGFAFSATNQDFAVVRYNPNGSLDTTFDGDGIVTTAVGGADDNGEAVLVLPDGSILVGGFASNGANFDFAFARYNQNGSVAATCLVFNYRSIGINAGILASAGTATVGIGQKRVTFSSPLPAPGSVGAVGVGDVLVLEKGTGNAETLYIVSRDSATQVTVHLPATKNHPGTAYEITRAYNTLQAWETARQGNLVGENRREIGFAYKDGPFTAPVVIDGSTTDANRFLHLTVAPGQRHVGRAGTGVALNRGTGPTGIFIAMDVRDDYTIVEGFEIYGYFWDGATGGGTAIVVRSATNVTINSLLIRDFDDLDATRGSFGIRSSSGSPATNVNVRNTIFYNGDQAAIQLNDAASSFTVQNCSIYKMARFGLERTAGAMTATNVISVGNGTSDFSGVITQSNNLSSDATAAGAGSLTLRSAANQFNSLAVGAEDLHLKGAADAIDQGTSLSSAFVFDIDDEVRPNGPQWDMGADERPSGSGSCPTVPRPWYDTSWKFRKPFILRSSRVTGNLSNFPVLVRQSSDADLAANAQSDGDDIFFTSADGLTKLSHEIEKFTSVTGELIAWVKVPYLSSGVDTTLYMYYGNATVGSQADATNVWDSSYGAVWHLKEDPSGGAPQFLDSTANPNDGTASALSTANQVSGKIDGSLSFDDSNERHVNVLDHASLRFGTNITASAWVRTTDVDADVGVIVNKWGPIGSRNYWLGKNNATDLAFFVDNTQSVIASLALISDNAWHHVAGVADASAGLLRIYVDGVQRNTAAYTGTSQLGANVLHIGNSSDVITNQEWSGGIDEVRVSGAARSLPWIQTEFNNQFDPPGFHSFCSVATTAVSLESFEAVGRAGAVELTWSTATEIDNLGFHLYRATTPSGPFARITKSAIPGLGSSPVGAGYRYLDSGLSTGTTYYYELEDIETTGRTKRHGPISATPLAALVEEGHRKDSAPTALITYGDPSKNSFRVVNRGRYEAVVELVTEGFYAEPQQDGTVILSVPGFEPLGEGDTPTIPVMRPWIDARAGRDVTVVSVRTDRDETLTGFVAAGQYAELVSSREGVVSTTRRSRTASAKRLGWFPLEPARVAGVGFQGDVKKAQLELAPLRWNGSSQVISLSRRMTIVLSFRRLSKEDAVEGDARRRRQREARRRESTEAFRIVTTEEGLYRVRYEDAYRGRRGITAESLRLSYQGESVAFHLEPAGSRVFGPGASLYFWSEGEKANPYGREAVYTLDTGSGGTPMESLHARPSGDVVSHYFDEMTVEQNRLYQAGLVDAEDSWFWDVLLAPVVKSYPFALEDLAVTDEPSRLTIWLQGASDFDADPDHHVSVSLNGAFLDQARWDGRRGHRMELTLPPGILREGGNSLEIDSIGDTGASYSMVFLNRFQVEYPRLPSVEMKGLFARTGTVRVRGASPAAHVLDLSELRPKWVAGAVSAGDALQFRVESGRRYAVVSESAVGRAGVRPAKATTLTKPTRRADYLVLGPAEFLAEAEPLLEHRRRQGLTTSFVALEDVYEAFGFGEARPEAIREFLTYVYEAWRKPAPRYVLLLGDATYDFKDYLQTGVPNRLPPQMIKTTYLWTASDPSFAAVHGNDPLPDVAIGRLPASSASELAVMVAKILAYEESESALDGPVVLVTDDSDDAGDFVGNAAAIERGVLSGRDVRTLSLGAIDASSMRGEIIRSFDEGPSLVSYIGHGGIHLWASENIFNIADVSSLSPQARQPLLLTMNCLNGYFHFPYFDSLAEKLVKAERKGAIAAFAPSGLSLDEPAHRLHEALLRAISSPFHRRLGDAVLAAQREYAETGAFAELVSIYHLLGDPALSLR